MIESFIRKIKNYKIQNFFSRQPLKILIKKKEIFNQSNYFNNKTQGQ